jgi:hypothetical protein
VDAVYARLLGRAPDPVGRRSMLGALDSADRIAVLRDVLAGVEARGRGIPADLPLPRAYDAVAAQLRAAWVEADDAAFAGRAGRALTGAPAAPSPDRVALVRRLAAGADVERADRLPPPDVMTRDELSAALVALATGDAFAERAFRILLGREADPAGVYAVAEWQRAGDDRGAALVRLASSDEATRRGVRADVVREIVESRAFRFRRAAGRVGRRFARP